MVTDVCFCSVCICVLVRILLSRSSRRPCPLFRLFHLRISCDPQQGAAQQGAAQQGCSTRLLNKVLLKGAAQHGLPTCCSTTRCSTRFFPARCSTRYTLSLVLVLHYVPSCLLRCRSEPNLLLAIQLSLVRVQAAVKILIHTGYVVHCTHDTRALIIKPALTSLCANCSVSRVQGTRQVEPVVWLRPRISSHRIGE